MELSSAPVGIQYKNNMEETSVFDGAINNENSFTELFRNMLKFKDFRDQFLSLLSFNIDVSKIEHENFETQASIAKHGRPDLILFTEEIELLFEIKVWNTGLTVNQPNGYFEHLLKSKVAKRGLVFILPNGYHQKQVLLKAKTELAKKDPDIEVNFVTWESIAQIIKDKEFDASSVIFKEYLIFLTRWLNLNPIVLSPLKVEIMFGKDFVESMGSTLNIVDNLYYRYKDKGYSVRVAKSLNFTQYGFELNLPEGDILFFGMWWNYWFKTGNPICVAFFGKSKGQLEIFESCITKAELEPMIEFENNYTTHIGKNSFLIGENEVGRILEIFTNELKVLLVKR